jgi:hypothetical protein
LTRRPAVWRAKIRDTAAMRSGAGFQSKERPIVQMGSNALLILG